MGWPGAWSYIWAFEMFLRTPMANCLLYYGPVTKGSCGLTKANFETNNESLRTSRRSSPYVRQTSDKSIPMTGKAYARS